MTFGYINESRTDSEMGALNSENLHSPQYPPSIFLAIKADTRAILILMQSSQGEIETVVYDDEPLTPISILHC